MQYRPSGIAVDATHVYWSSYLGGAILRIDKAGVGPVQVVASAPNPVRVMLDETHVYFDTRTPTGATKTLRANKTGGTTELLGDGDEMKGLDPTHYYRGDSFGFTRINKTNPADWAIGGNLHPGTFLSVDGFMWLPHRGGVSVDSQDLRAADITGLKRSLPILRWDFAYSSSSRPMLGGIGEMATDGCDLYFTTEFETPPAGGSGPPDWNRNIVRLRLGDTRVEGIVAHRAPALALQADATHVYWLEKTRIARAPK